MNEITPGFAATLARDVYKIVDSSSLASAIRQLDFDYKGSFAFNQQNLLKGKTGGPGIIKCRTAFGFTLIGQGHLKGHAFILFRGTKFLADWLTNLNAGVSSSACGYPVHDGFNTTFNTMKPKLQAFMNYARSQNIHSVHCIGHSLGGAVATVCAEWIAKSYSTPYLYTFGSPRVGLMGFANSCTQRLGQQRIFRAYHRTDIVPFVPSWPFIHTPDKGRDYYLPSPGIIPWKTYHSMDRYIQSVQNRSWKAIGSRPNTHSNGAIENWLKQNTVVAFTLSNIEWLNDAIVYVLKKCVNKVGWGISNTFGSALTLMDKMAYILKKGIDLAQSISTSVVHLLNKMMLMLGYSQNTVYAMEYTHAIIRRLFMRLQYRLMNHANQALSQVLVKGQNI